MNEKNLSNGRITENASKLFQKQSWNNLIEESAERRLRPGISTFSSRAEI